MGFEIAAGELVLLDGDSDDSSSDTDGVDCDSNDCDSKGDMNKSDMESDNGNDNDEDVDDDPRGTAIVEITNNRKGNKEVLVKWNNGHISWEPTELVKRDEEELVLEYFSSKNNWKETCQESHKDFSRFKLEDTISYWNDGQRLHHVMCEIYEGITVPQGKRFPSYVCHNSMCTVTVCYKCFADSLRNSNHRAGTRRTRDVL